MTEKGKKNPMKNNYSTENHKGKSKEREKRTLKNITKKKGNLAGS